MIINQSIQAKVFELQSASRITSIAKKKLGMISNPKAPQIVDK
jgi:cell division protein FtsL